MMDKASFWKQGLSPAIVLHVDFKNPFTHAKVAFVDIAVYQVLRATEAQFLTKYANMPFTKLATFKSRMEARPKIKAYIDSTRCHPFCWNSMM